jgi:very-short-patch-repair endonuclease
LLTRSISSKRKALLAARATCMKAAPTPSEARLWGALVNDKLGVSFRRQAVIGGFIVDYVAPSVRLVRVDAALVIHDLAAAGALVRAAIQQRRGLTLEYNGATPGRFDAFRK